MEIARYLFAGFVFLVSFLVLRYLYKQRKKRLELDAFLMHCFHEIFKISGAYRPSLNSKDMEKLRDYMKENKNKLEYFN